MVEIPFVVTYCGSCLIYDLLSGLWVVFQTEWVAKYAAYFQWDLYNTYRIWYIPPLVRGNMRDLTLKFVFESDIYYRELLDLIEVVNGLDWSKFPISQARRGTRCFDASPGRTGSIRNFVWYYPYNSEFVDTNTTRDRSS